MAHASNWSDCCVCRRWPQGQVLHGSATTTEAVRWRQDPSLSIGGIMIGLKSALCFATLTLPLALGGCAGALLVGGLAGVAGGGYAAAQERGVGGAVSDLQIETNVESVFAATDPGLKDGITTTVYQGRVLLTGTVPTPQMKTRAVERSE